MPRHTLRVSFDQDDEDAVGVYRLVANQGHSAAWFNSGHRYENDTGVDHDKLNFKWKRGNGAAVQGGGATTQPWRVP